MILLVEFKLTVLRTQEELRTQILGGLGSGTIFFNFGLEFEDCK